jgi:anti-sigma factor RsiW
MLRRLDDYLDRELSPEEMRRAEEHLETCAACRSEVVDLREVTARLTPDGEPPAGVWSQVSRAIRQREERVREGGPASSQLDAGHTG